MSQASAVARVFLCGLAALLLCTPARAQFRAAVQGTIMDSSGAAIPAAKVTLTNEETGVQQETESGAEGFYRFSQLAPGRYTVAAEVTGFKKAVKEHVEVRAEQLEGVDMTLTPGEVTESVTVSAEDGPQLQTETANIDGTISTEEVLRLPQIGRDPYELARLAPGVFGLGSRGAGGEAVSFPNSAGPGGSNASIFQVENQVPISANGQRVTANNFELDGVGVNSQAWGGAAVLTPNQESVKEIRVVSSSYSAENGRNTGAVVQVVSQNGTNDFHGSFVYKLNDPALNAFNRWGGPFGGTPRRVENRQHQYAGSLGGPVIKNRLFFFASYERASRSSDNVGTMWLETPEFVQLVQNRRPNGIANRILGFSGMRPQVTQVLSRDCASVGLTAANCRAVNGGLDIGSPGGSIGQRVTDPLGGGLDGVPDLQFVERVSPDSTTAQQFNWRVDFQATGSDLIALSYYYTPNDTTFFWGARPAQEFLSARRNIAGALLWTKTMSPTMINEARFNVTRWYFDEIESNPDIPWGIPGVRSADVPFPFSVEWGVGGAGVFYQTTYNFRDVLSKVIDTHALKFGVEVTKEQNNDTVAWAARPSYQFGSLWNFVNDAPSDQYGFFDPRNGFPTDLKKYIRTSIYGLFVQDDWKVRPNLTVNLGLRWEYFTPVKEKYDNISNVLLGANDPLGGARVRVGGYLWDPDRNNLAPQVGFAWSPQAFLGRDLQSRFVVRGGFGMGYNRIPMSLSLNGRLNPPFFGEFNLTGSDVRYSLGNDIQSFYGWPNNPATILRIDPNTNIPLEGAPVNVFGIPTDLRTPYTMRYSLDLQYDLGANWLASIGYQGSGGRKFPRTINYSLFFDRNPRLNTVRFMRNDVSSNFNALLTRLERRFSGGVQLSAQYRWSKSIDTCSNDDNCPQTYPFDLRQERGPSDYDATHYFVGSGLWELPFLRGRSDLLGAVAGGWQINGIVTASSGFPWTPVYRGPNCAALSNRGELCPLRPIAYLGGAGTDYSDETFQQTGGNFPGGGLRYFVPPPPTTGTLPPPPGIGRNSFRGPRYFSTDMSFIKRVNLPRMPFLGEAAGVDLRFNFFNIFNQLNLRPFGFDSASTQINSGTFGQATDATSGRVAEFQVRFNF